MGFQSGGDGILMGCSGTTRFSHINFALVAEFTAQSYETSHSGPQTFLSRLDDETVLSGEIPQHFVATFGRFDGFGI